MAGGNTAELQAAVVTAVKAMAALGPGPVNLDEVSSDLLSQRLFISCTFSNLFLPTLPNVPSLCCSVH